MLYNLFENRDFISAFAVALLAEGVDRNKTNYDASSTTLVALLAEGVDRNLMYGMTVPHKTCRPPRGGRG